MKTLKVSFIYLITVFTFVLISGCSKEENPTANGGTGGTPGAIDELIGTWNATSVKNPNIEGGMELINAENTGKFTFTATNYTYNLTGQFCDEGEETCTDTGPVTATATSFTITWSEGDTETQNYTLSGNTLTTSYEDGGTYTIICQKQ